jgi:hypothetical protein
MGTLWAAVCAAALLLYRTGWTMPSRPISPPIQGVETSVFEGRAPRFVKPS